MTKQYFIITRIVLLTVFFNLITFSQVPSPNHESLPYQLFFINIDYCGIFFITGTIHIESKTLVLEYEPVPPYNEQVVVMVGEVVGDFKDIKIIDSVNIASEKLIYQEKSNTKKFKIKKLRREIKIIVWANEVKSRPSQFVNYDKHTLLEQTKAIYSEQQRLSIYGMNKGEKELLIETCRNIEE